MRHGILTIDKTLYDKAREKFKDNRNKEEERLPQALPREAGTKPQRRSQLS
jgi:hypothetical protein